MGLCLNCNAEYIQGIAMCPACGNPLEGAEAPEPKGEFVPVLTAPYAEAAAARATLEAAGIETDTVSDHFSDLSAYMPQPFFMTVLVRERDLSAARQALGMKRDSSKRDRET